MARLSLKRKVDVDHPSLTKSVDAALGCFDGSRRASSEFLQDVLLTLGLIAESVDAPSDVRRAIAADLVSCAERANVPAHEVFDWLLDLRALIDHQLTPV
jgi:hypothetical protein